MCDINAIVHIHVKANHMNEYMCQQYKYISIYVIKAYAYIFMHAIQCGWDISTRQYICVTVM